MIAELPQPEKRKPGRPKGTPNKSAQITRDEIIRRGAPVKLLCDIAAGRKIKAAGIDGKPTAVFPTLEQRKDAAKILAHKVISDLKTNEITTPNGTLPAVEALLAFAQTLVTPK